jgi:hypothetical protein
MNGKNAPWHTDKVRARIQLTKLVTRVQQFAFGQKDDHGREIVMSSDQLRAALALIGKGLPDLKHVEHSGTIAHEHFAVQATTAWLGETLADAAVGAPAEPRTH